MTTVIRNYEEGELIPDVDNGEYYTFEELDGALFLDSNDITGAETYLLTNGKTVVLHSVDLDWVEPYEDKSLRTLSVQHFGKCALCNENIWLRADVTEDNKLTCTNCIY